MRKPRQINEQCAGCHTTAWAEFRKPHAHRLAWGAMSCIDCHNPHGTINPRQVRTFAANEPGCLSCHSDKRGPFTFEHAPMRFESCQSCHQPHGSTNPRMLTRHEVRFLCLECHSNLGLQSTALGNVPACVSRSSFTAVSELHDLSSKGPRKSRGPELPPMRLSLIVSFVLPLVAQTPAPESLVPEPETELTGFIDLGYRWRTGVGGSLDAYRSVVDLGSGPKLLRTEFSFQDTKGKTARPHRPARI
jgi:predicted CXXCH cytochrome family protein